MRSPRVGVIIPCYNQERYVGLTINSALAQNYADFSVVVVDDGSTDNTPAILNTYSDRITILKHDVPGNHGQAAALNLGIKYTESEYVAFLDSDDLWHPDKLRKQVEVLDRYPEVGLVYSNGNVIDGEGGILYQLFGKDHREANTAESILLNCYIRTPSLVMVRRSILQAVGPFPVGIIPSDHDMWVRIAEVSRYSYLDEMLVGYRQHSGQISLRKTRKMWEDSLLVLNAALQRYPYAADTRRKRLAVIHYRLGEYGLRSKMFGPTFYHFLMAFWHDPVRACNKVCRLQK